MAVFKNNSRIKLPDWFPVGKNRITCLKGVCVGLLLANVSHLRLTCTVFEYEFHLSCLIDGFAWHHQHEARG